MTSKTDVIDLQKGVKLRSRSGYAKLIVKPYPASKAKTIVKELLELAKSISEMTDLAGLIEEGCGCGECSADARKRIVAEGKIIVIRRGADEA